MAKGNSGSATWSGGIKSGGGTVSTQSGALDAQPFGFNTRFADGVGTNPEELIGAALAGCFSMALSKELGEEGLDDPQINASASLHINETDSGIRIDQVQLSVQIGVDGDDAAVDRAVAATKAGCPVANLLDVDIDYDIKRA